MSLLESILPKWTSKWANIFANLLELIGIVGTTIFRQTRMPPTEGLRVVPEEAMAALRAACLTGIGKQGLPFAEAWMISFDMVQQQTAVPSRAVNPATCLWMPSLGPGILADFPRDRVRQGSDDHVPCGTIWPHSDFSVFRGDFLVFQYTYSANILTSMQVSPATDCFGPFHV